MACQDDRMRVLSIEQILQILPLFDDYVGVVHDGAARRIDNSAGGFSHRRHQTRSGNIM